MSIFTQALPTALDLNESSFLEACRRLSAKPSAVTLYISEANWGVALVIADAHRCMALEIPAGILKGKFMWCVRSGDRVVYSDVTTD